MGYLASTMILRPTILRHLVSNIKRIPKPVFLLLTMLDKWCPKFDHLTNLRTKPARVDGGKSHLENSSTKNHHDPHLRNYRVLLAWNLFGILFTVVLVHNYVPRKQHTIETESTDPSLLISQMARFLQILRIDWKRKRRNLRV